MIASLDDLADRYPVIFCDVWGVLHNGASAFSSAAEALVRQRERGKSVILITNAPRPYSSVVAQLESFGIDPRAWDRVITSGDVTQKLITGGPRKIFHIGPDRDLLLFDGLGVELVDYTEADAVVCTGFFDNERETPEDYVTLLAILQRHKLPFICANPDIAVERGSRVVWCAGALEREYVRLGGSTIKVGKPYRPIYEAAMAAARELRRDPRITPYDVLAIGDGLFTDVKGAVDNGFDVLYVAAGIHAKEYWDLDGLHVNALHNFLESSGFNPFAVIPKLR